MYSTIGIDPGATGCICRLELADTPKACWVALYRDAPKLLGVPYFTDLYEHKNYISDMIMSLDGGHIWLEEPPTKVSERKGSIAKAKQQRGFAFIEGLLWNRYKPHNVLPQTWQAEIRRTLKVSMRNTKKFQGYIYSSEAKATTIECALRLLPIEKLQIGRAKKPSPDRADAFCIALYGLIQLAKG